MQTMIALVTEGLRIACDVVGKLAMIAGREVPGVENDQLELR